MVAASPGLLASVAGSPVSPGGTLSATGFRGASTAILAGWLASLGFDMFLHAGLLAGLYARGGPFLLPAADAFARIPLGYAAFLIFTAALYWLLLRLGVADGPGGMRLGLGVGVVVWGVHALGLYSISTVPGDLVLGWAVGQPLELALAGYLMGRSLGGMPPRRLVAVALAVGLVFALAAVVLQSAGLAPPMAGP